MSFPTKSEREKCWSSRDELWQCLDENRDKQEVCAKFRALYESSCPSQWVKHFDRKREYLKFKDRIQNEGSSNLPMETLLTEPSSGKEEGQSLTPATPRSASTSPNARVFRKFQPQTFT